MAGLTFKIKGDHVGALDSIKKVRAKFAELSDTASKGFQTRIGQRAFDGMIIGAGKAVDLTREAIKAASDLNETVSKSQVVFGDSAGEMEAWASTAATAMGQSKQGALESAATMGNLFVSMGIGSDRAADMSRRLVELGSDLASFNNTSPEDAIQAIGSGLRGEAEPLRRFGVLLDEATLKQKALSMGLSDGKGTLDPVTKAMAAYEIILDKTKTAQGDFSRTSDGLANSQRQLKAMWEDQIAALGQELLPVAKDVVATLKAFPMSSLVEAGKDLASTFANLNPVMGGFINDTKRAIQAQGALNATMEKGDALLNKFDAGKIANSATSREELATAVAEIERAKQDLSMQLHAIGKNMDEDEFKRLSMVINDTVTMLSLKQSALGKVTDAQLDANRATRDAEIAEIKHAQALKDAAAAAAEAKKEFDKLLEKAGKESFDKLPLTKQLEELEQKQKDVRAGLSDTLKERTLKNAGPQEVMDYAKSAAGTYEQSDADIVAATKLLEVQQEIAKVKEELAKKQADEAARANEAATSYQEKLDMINAELSGNEEKIRQLKNERAMREEILSLVKAGYSLPQATMMAGRLVSKQNQLEDKDAAKKKEEKRADRQKRLEESGIDAATAQKLSGSESGMEEALKLKDQYDSRGDATVVASSSARIGGGGGVYEAGINYQRQIAEYNQKMVALLEKIANPGGGDGGIFEDAG